jgi:hypothetical protein
MADPIDLVVSQPALRELCRRHRIRRLSLFGSVLREDFGPDSDVDVLVDFDEDSALSAFDVVDVQQELSRLLNRRVDLVEESALTNPFRRREILRTRRVVVERS